MKRIVLVGNAELCLDYAPFVDDSDLVIRFNLPATWGAGSGKRFDIWVIANGKGGRHFARQQSFANSPFRDLAREIWFPRPLGVHRTISLDPNFGGHEHDLPAAEDAGNLILRRNHLRQPVQRFWSDFYLRCIGKLYALADAGTTVLMPSAGFLATHYVLEEQTDAEIFLIGFTFKGWAGHPWQLEENNIQSLQANGRLRLLPTR